MKMNWNIYEIGNLTEAEAAKMANEKTTVKGEYNCYFIDFGGRSWAKPRRRAPPSEREHGRRRTCGALNTPAGFCRGNYIFPRQNTANRKTAGGCVNTCPRNTWEDLRT